MNLKKRLRVINLFFIYTFIFYLHNIYLFTQDVSLTFIVMAFSRRIYPKRLTMVSICTFEK